MGSQVRKVGKKPINDAVVGAHYRSWLYLRRRVRVTKFFRKFSQLMRCENKRIELFITGKKM